MMENDWSIPEELQPTWDVLDEGAPEPLSREATQRISGAMGAVRTTHGAGTQTRKRLAASIVLAFAAGMAGGYGASTIDPGADSGLVGPSGGEQYLLLVRETASTEGAVRERGMDAVVEEYARWAGGLASEQRLVAAEKLSEWAEWVGPGAPGMSSPISGFFLIRAADEDAAMAIARESPHVALGGVLEIRRVERAP